MTRAYSEDLRRRVVAAVEGWGSCRHGARFGVAISTVVKRMQRWRRTGSVAARPIGGDRRSRLTGEHDWLLAPDLTLQEIRAELGRRGIRVGHGTVRRFFTDQGIRFKKACTSTSGIARRRPSASSLEDASGKADPVRLVFIDETWAKTNMTRSHGQCAKGRRLPAKMLHGRWRTPTFLAALRADRIDASCVLQGSINGISFLAYVEQVLAPTLKPGDFVILDKPRQPGKEIAVRRAMRAASAKLLFLLAGSQPDRTRLRQVQDPAAQGRRANPRGHLAAYRDASRPLPAAGMPQLLENAGYA
jgi:transposase